MTKKAKAGRPSKLSPEAQASIVSALESGCYLETAAAMAGITRQTLYDWLKRGAEEESGPFHDFRAAATAALAKSEAEDLKTIRAARGEHWQAAAWRLERRYPQRWGKQRADEAWASGAFAELLARVKERLDPDAYYKVIEVLAETDTPGEHGRGGNGEPF